MLFRLARRLVPRPEGGGFVVVGVLAVTKRGPVLLLRSQHMRGCGVLGSAEDTKRTPERLTRGGATRVGSSQSVAARGADMSWRESG